jgi:CSLREA domain-containing protein
MILGRTASASRGVHRSAVLALLALAGVSLGQQPVRAATITVNSTADNTTARDGQCTLREAIANVNAGDDTSGGDCTAGTGSGDTIVFNLTLPATITLTMKKELEIDTGVTINGPTTGVLAVDGNGQVDVFDITNGTVSITNLTIQNGLGSEGGGIYNDATLTLTSCTLSGNSGDDGGGVYNNIDGTATLTNCTLSGNSALNDLGGGGVYSDGTLTLTGCTLSGNSGVDGGGVYNDADGTATLTNCTLSGNSAPDDLGGGGVYSDGALTLSGCTLNGNSGIGGGGVYNDDGGTATLTNCTLSDNSAPDEIGGGIYSDGALTLTGCTLNGNSGVDGGGVYNDVDGTATLTNCTLSDNSALNDLGGGGIYNEFTLTLTSCTLNGNSGVDGGGVYNDFGGTATLTNCTLSGNSATGSDFGGGGLYSDGTVALTNCTLNGNSAPLSNGGGLYNDSDGTATLINTIVADSPSGHNCAGTGIEEGDHNLSSDATCFVSPDLLSTDPHLAPLANYGGPTATLALCTAEGSPDPSCSGPSPAIDAGDDSVTGPPLNLTTDQRGLARKWGLHVDIGAYEAQQATTLMCVGDCDGNGQVALDDILTMVNIALGNAEVWVCELGDSNKDDLITVDEILTAVNNALNGCG